MAETHRENVAGAQTEFGPLLERVRKGDEEAARQLIENYGPHILRVVRRRLNRKLRSKFDSIDFVQAVWASFFARREEIARFQQPEEIVAFLGAVATNKVIDEVRMRLQHRRRRVEEEELLEPGTPRHDAALAADQPTPSEAVALKELWEYLLEDQPSHFRRILHMRRSGLPYEEIARRTGTPERTVRRIIEKLVSKRIPWATFS
jgi:RNA polymerase sigma factor (sigma-70 family)